MQAIARRWQNGALIINERRRLSGAANIERRHLQYKESQCDVPKIIFHLLFGGFGNARRRQMRHGKQSYNVRAAR